MDQKPLTAADVRDVVFDKAPRGKRGYNEKQVDEFLDRIEATLGGADHLTADDVRAAVFEDAPMIKRGYHEDQVDAFLDTVVATLEQLARTGSPRVTHPAGPQPVPVPGPSPAEQTMPMPFIQPPSLPADDPAPPTEPLEHAEPLEVLLTPPLPPAPPGARGYRPGDVKRLTALLARAAQRPGAPTAAEVLAVRLRLTFYNGEGYHTGAVDALRAAWAEELRDREG